MMTPEQFAEKIKGLILLNGSAYMGFLKKDCAELLTAHDAEVRAETLQEERREILERADGMDAVWIRGWLVSRLHGAAKHLPDPHYRERIELEARIATLDKVMSGYEVFWPDRLIAYRADLESKLAALDAPKGEV